VSGATVEGLFLQVTTPEGYNGDITYALAMDRHHVLLGVCSPLVTAKHPALERIKSKSVVRHGYSGLLEHP
jgi:hypothetical protein